jgi:hypothetical protein
MYSKWLAACAIAVGTLTVVPAGAQSTLGYAPTILIPVVAQTVSFASEIFVHNPQGATPLTVNITLVEATTSSVPGPHTCTQLVVPAGGSASFALNSQCTLAPGVTHFGYMVLQDASTEGLNPMFAYSRVQNPQAIGFSVEGFPAGGLAGQSQRVNGLKRTLAPAPIPFQTNCFVGSFDKPVDYFIRLKNAAGTNVGSGIQGHLDAHQMIRHLDIFAAAGLAASDFSNVSATFSSVNASTAGNRDHPLYFGFCTVQDNASFGADFRIAKVFSGWDATHSQSFGGCTPAECGAYDYALSDAGKKQVFQVFIRPPDRIVCSLLSDRLGELGMRLRQPRSLGDCDLCGLPPGSTAALTTPGAIVAGAFDQTTFTYDTGTDVIRPTDGAQTRDIWTIEVSARNGTAPVVPLPFSLTCKSGNGIAQAAPFETVDDF